MKFHSFCKCLVNPNLYAIILPPGEKWGLADTATFSNVICFTGKDHSWPLSTTCAGAWVARILDSTRVAWIFGGARITGVAWILGCTRITWVAGIARHCFRLGGRTHDAHLYGNRLGVGSAGWQRDHRGRRRQ